MNLFKFLNVCETIVPVAWPLPPDLKRFQAKAVNSILRHVGEQLGFDSDEQLEDLYDKTAWHFDRKLKKRASSYDMFKKAIS